jgi:hypothetical protein
VNGEVSARYQKRDLGKKGNVIGVEIFVFITRSKDIRAINHVLLGQGRDIIIYHSKRRKL